MKMTHPVKMTALILWITCIPLLLPMPWDRATEAERIMSEAKAMQDKHVAQGGVVAPGTAIDSAAILRVRQAAWVEWIWLAAVVILGFLGTILARTPRAFSIVAVLAAAVYLLCRWYYLSSSYKELFRAIYDEGSRSGQSFLATTVPLAYAVLTYYNIVVPIALLVLAVLGMRKTNSLQSAA